MCQLNYRDNKEYQLAHGAHPALNREAVRLVRAMPRWIPGHNEGHPIAVTYTLPITFRLH